MHDRLEHQRRRKGPECLSDFQIDCLVLGAATSASLEQGDRLWRAHTESCELCGEKLRHAGARRERFSQDHPIAAISAATLAKLEDTSRRPFWTMPKLVGILSGAGAVAVTLVVALTAPPEEGDHGRLKGGASFGVYVKRGESVFKGDSGAVYFPGDRLQFYHSNAEPQHFAIFDVEPSGGVSVFVPFQGAQPVLVPEAREKTLPGSIELDDSEGRERLLGVFCAATFDLGIVTKQLAKLGLAADGASDVLDLGIGPKCSIMSFIINKSRRRE